MFQGIVLGFLGFFDGKVSVDLKMLSLKSIFQDVLNDI